MQTHSQESRKHREAFRALGILETQCLGFNPMGGEEITPKSTANLLPALKQGRLGSAF